VSAALAQSAAAQREEENIAQVQFESRRLRYELYRKMGKWKRFIDSDAVGWRVRRSRNYYPFAGATGFCGVGLSACRRASARRAGFLRTRE
jgi:hypothetical protein